MIETKILNKYKVTIGIECHVQLKTKTKLFSGASNDARQAAPNSLVNHIDFGAPGALPVLGEAAVEMACRAAFALGTTPQEFSRFDRKHYFYPDLPSGYQITQFEQPIITGGQVAIKTAAGAKVINITRAHLEADAGKSTHPTGADYSLVDLNRAGTPLLEIVSEPEMSSAAEARAYAHELYLLMRYSGASDADLYYGNMRFDVNVSVSQSDQLGVRTETKNLNSFKSIEKAAEYEIERQIKLIENGKQVIQETRGWLDDEQKTVSQRSKEDAHDYRYMPEPDVPPLVLDQQLVDDIKAQMPPMPAVLRDRFKELGIDSKTVEDIINLPEVAASINRIIELTSPQKAKRIAFWMLLSQGSNSHDEDDGHSAKSDSPVLIIDQQSLIELATMVEDGDLSSTAAKDVLLVMEENVIAGKSTDPRQIAAASNLLQVSDEKQLGDFVKQVLTDNPKAVQDIKQGEVKAIGFLVGQVMKLSSGQANPGMVRKLIDQQLKG